MRDNYKLLFLLIGNLWFIAGTFTDSIVPSINGLMWLMGLMVIVWLDFRELDKKLKALHKEKDSLMTQIEKELAELEAMIEAEAKENAKKTKSKKRSKNAKA